MLCALQNDSITPEPFKDDQVAQLLGQYSMRKERGASMPQRIGC